MYNMYMYIYIYICVYYIYMYTYMYIYIHGGFHKWGTPIAGSLIRENPTKMDDLGYPYFRKPPCNTQ